MGLSSKMILLLTNAHALTRSASYALVRQREPRGSATQDRNAEERNKIKKPLSKLHFIHIPANGGASIVHWAKDHNNGTGPRWGEERTDWPGGSCPYGCENVSFHPCSPWHTPLAVYRDHGQSPFTASDRETFCVVRHPLSRALSAVQWFEKRQHSPGHEAAREKHPDCSAARLNLRLQQILTTMQASLKQAEGEFPRIQSKTLGRNVKLWDANNASAAGYGDCHWLPQWLYVKESCDHVLRYERLNEDFAKLMDGFVDPITPDVSSQLPAIDLCNGTHPTVGDLDATTQQLLRAVYHRDFELFGYDPLPQNEAAAWMSVMENRSKRARDVATALAEKPCGARRCSSRMANLSSRQAANSHAKIARRMSRSLSKARVIQVRNDDVVSD